MNIGAFNILDELKLSHPYVYDLKNIKDIKDESVLFVRYCDGEKHKNHTISGIAFKDNVSNYIVEYQNGLLVQIADVITGIGGFAVYLYDKYIYGEYVDGEIVSLLRGGYCQKRFLIDREKGNIRVLTVDQQVICKNINHKYIWKEYHSEMNDKEFLNRLFTLKKLLMNIKDTNGLLLEGHFLENSLIFSDAPHKTINIDFHRIFQNSNEVWLRGSAENIHGVSVDHLNIDIDPKVDLVCIRKGALLCHYITYYINELNVFFKMYEKENFQNVCLNDERR